MVNINVSLSDEAYEKLCLDAEVLAPLEVPADDGGGRLDFRGAERIEGMHRSGRRPGGLITFQTQIHQHLLTDEN